MKDERRNYIFVGSFVIAMLAALILWIALLSGRTGSTDDYYITYHNVGGLKEGTEILFEGYPVGLIDEIRPIDTEEGRRFRVDVSVKRDWGIPDDSTAEIQASGLLSAVVIEIGAGESQTDLAPGSQIPSVEAANVIAAVTSVAAQLGQIATDIKPLVDSLVEGTPVIIDEVSAFTSELNTTLDRIKTVLKPENTQAIERILGNLDTTSGNVASASAGLRQTQARVDDLMVTVEGFLDEEEGDLGLALGDLQHSLESVARHIDAISHNLEATTRNMNEFSRQIRENPGVIIRGRETGDDPGSN